MAGKPNLIENLDDHMRPGMKIAIVGAGISGLLTARLLCKDHDIQVFESCDYAGGHTHTVPFEAFGNQYAVDTGFMVFNHRTYPHFMRMLKLLGIPSRSSDMSFSVRCGRCGLEYQGSSLNGLFAQRRNLFRASFHRMLLDILRFNRSARELLREEGETLELGEYLARGRFSRQFIDHYLVPMGAAIWSARPDLFLQFPARFIIAFFDNHGLLTVRNHPPWQTVSGGAARYVDALTRPFADRIRLNCPVASVARGKEWVAVTTQNGVAERFDCVVLAAHADQSLTMLSDATETEREILSSIPYQRNDTVLHTDPSLLPRSRRAWASWNYYVPEEEKRPVVLTYTLNRLQGQQSPKPICVTLNAEQALDGARIVKRIVYHHPTYSRAARAAQKRFHEINGKNRTYFCGAYWGYGFHEDGVNSALAVGECFGRRLESC
jgi:predicted NAD/FAD-binding protein